MPQNYTSKDKMLRRTNFSIYKLSRRNAFEQIQEIHMKIVKCNTNATTALLPMVILCLIPYYVVFSKNFITSRIKQLLFSYFMPGTRLFCYILMSSTLTYEIKFQTTTITCQFLVLRVLFFTTQNFSHFSTELL